MFKTICYIIALAALILLIGTAGAMETNLISQLSGMIRCIIFQAVSAGCVFVAGRYA